MIVVDASLAAKWLLEEPGSRDALDILQRKAGELSAPNILMVEVSAAVVRRVNMGELSGNDAKVAFAKWDAILASRAITFSDDSAERVRSAVQLAILLGRSLKDCLYLLLARERDAVLATCDDRLVEKSRRVHAKVARLADIDLNKN